MKTTPERLTLLEERIHVMNLKLDEYFKESKSFHSELLEKIEKLDGEKVQMATLREKVQTLEKITWIALTAGLGSMVKALVDLIQRG